MMHYSTYEEIHKDKIEFTLRVRYAAEIQQLFLCGFGEEIFVREVSFPFSALVLLPIGVLHWFQRELLRVEFPLRLIWYNPVMLNQEFATYAYIQARGVKFTTGFEDGTMLVTTNYASGVLTYPQPNFVRYGFPNATLENTWIHHGWAIKRRLGEGHILNHSLRLAEIIELERRSERVVG